MSNKCSSPGDSLNKWISGCEHLANPSVNNKITTVSIGGSGTRTSSTNVTITSQGVGKATQGVEYVNGRPYIDISGDWADPPVSTRSGSTSASSGSSGVQYVNGRPYIEFGNFEDSPSSSSSSSSSVNITSSDPRLDSWGPSAPPSNELEYVNGRPYADMSGDWVQDKVSADPKLDGWGSPVSTITPVGEDDILGKYGYDLSGDYQDQFDQSSVTPGTLGQEVGTTTDIASDSGPNFTPNKAPTPPTGKTITPVPTPPSTRPYIWKYQ